MVFLFFKFAAAVSLALVFATRADGLVVNYWPFYTGERETRDADVHHRQSLGPLFFHHDGERREIRGVRPLWITFESKEREREQFHFLYPLYNRRSDAGGVSRDLLTVVSLSRLEHGEEEETTFRLFPFIFYRNSPDEDRNHLGFLPVAGNTHNLLGFDRASWVLFPFYIRLDKNDVVTRGHPWPFIRTVRGDETRGLHLWPIHGRVVKEGVFDRRYFVWPLGFRVRSGLDTDQPLEATGFLPFYSFSSSPAAESKTYLWPFFGYTLSQEPEYWEHRYFWPFFVQRRGDSHINRWAPFYSYSVRAGLEKTWVLWPAYRRTRWMDRDLLVERTQFFYFLYWNMSQIRPESPGDGRVVKRHLWPLFSHWNNAAGRSQTQVLSPFEVFYPSNEIIRWQYSPLFALYRRDLDGDRVTHSLLWNLAAWGRDGDHSYFQLGPLLTVAGGGERSEFSLLGGLYGHSRAGDDRRHRLFWIPVGGSRPEAHAQTP